MRSLIQSGFRRYAPYAIGLAGQYLYNNMARPKKAAIAGRRGRTGASAAVRRRRNLGSRRRNPFGFVLRGAKRTKLGGKRSFTKSKYIDDTDREGYGQHNDMSKTLVKIWNGPQRLRSCKVSSCINKMFGTSVSRVSGDQLIYDAFHLVTKSQLMNATPVSNTAVTKDSWAANPWDMNPFQGSTNGALLSANQAPALDKAYISHINGEFSLTNLENIPTEVTVYFYKYKITTNDDFTTCWNNALATNQYGQSVATPGITTTAPKPGAMSSGFWYGQKPFGHPSMRKMFKVLKRQNHKLEPGSTKKIIMKIEYNRYIYKDYFSHDSDEFMKGWTIGCCIIAKASPVKDTVSYTGNGNMVPGPVEIGTTLMYNVYLKYPNSKRLYTYRTDAGFQNESTLANISTVNDQDTKVSVIQV